MTIEEAICRRVETLVAGSPVVPTIALDVLPQPPTYPAICVRLINETTEYTLDGTVNVGGALVQVDCFTIEADGNDPYADATELAVRVHGRTGVAGLSGWAGPIEDGGSPAETLRILGCFRRDRRRQYDPDADRVVSIQQDYYVMYKPNPEV